ncbi:MAG: YbbR-like domain-containing protein [Bradymonadia bacterium]
MTEPFSGERRRPWLYRTLTRNFTQKAVALALAVVLFVLVREDKTAVVNRSVRVRVAHPVERILVSPLVESITLTIEGKFSRLRDLEAQFPEFLDLNLTGFENEQLTFEREMFKLPRGLVIRSIRPPAMMVQFEAEVVARRPVRVNTEGEPARDFRVVQKTVEPDEVTVKGPASQVNAITEVQTETIKLSGRERSATLTARLARAPENVVFLGPQSYTVTLEIEERQGTRVLSGRPVVIRSLPADGGIYEVSPATVNITLHGPQRALARLDAEALEAYVDASDIDPKRRGLQERPIKFDLPNGLRLGGLSPSVAALARKDEPKPPPPDAGPDASLEPDGGLDGGVDP